MAEEDLPPHAASELELERVAKLRDALQDSPRENDEADLFTRATLLRFLRARPTIAKSASMHHDMLAWHRSYKPREKMAVWQADDSAEAALIKKYFPCGTHGVDVHGRQVYYGRYGITDFAGIIREAGYDRFMTKGVSDQVVIMDKLSELSRKTGTAYYTNVVVIDLGGFEVRRTLRGVPWFGKYVKVLDNNWPERLAVAFVVRAPWIFAQVWKVVSPMLSADTRKKVQILGKGADHLAAMEKAGVPLEQIPTWLGGSSEEAWSHGDGGTVKGGDGGSGGETAGGDGPTPTEEAAGPRRAAMPEEGTAGAAPRPPPPQEPLPPTSASSLAASEVEAVEAAAAEGEAAVVVQDASRSDSAPVPKPKAKPPPLGGPLMGEGEKDAQAGGVVEVDDHRQAQQASLEPPATAWTPILMIAFISFLAWWLFKP
jgi:hypothetical protein